MKHMITGYSYARVGLMLTLCAGVMDLVAKATPRIDAQERFRNAQDAYNRSKSVANAQEFVAAYEQYGDVGTSRSDQVRLQSMKSLYKKVRAELDNADQKALIARARVKGMFEGAEAFEREGSSELEDYRTLLIAELGKKLDAYKESELDKQERELDKQERELLAKNYNMAKIAISALSKEVTRLETTLAAAGDRGSAPSATDEARVKLADRKLKLATETMNQLAILANSNASAESKATLVPEGMLLLSNVLSAALDKDLDARESELKELTKKILAAIPVDKASVSALVKKAMDESDAQLRNSVAIAIAALAENGTEITLSGEVALLEQLSVQQKGFAKGSPEYKMYEAWVTNWPKQRDYLNTAADQLRAALPASSSIPAVPREVLPPLQWPTGIMSVINDGNSYFIVDLKAAFQAVLLLESDTIPTAAIAKVSASVDSTAAKLAAVDQKLLAPRIANAKLYQNARVFGTDVTVNNVAQAQDLIKALDAIKTGPLAAKAKKLADALRPKVAPFEKAAGSKEPEPKKAAAGEEEKKLAANKETVQALVDVLKKRPTRDGIDQARNLLDLYEKTPNPDKGFVSYIKRTLDGLELAL